MGSGGVLLPNRPYARRHSRKPSRMDYDANYDPELGGECSSSVAPGGDDSSDEAPPSKKQRRKGAKPPFGR